jgi:hypothetical protein
VANPRLYGHCFHQARQPGATEHTAVGNALAGTTSPSSSPLKGPGALGTGRGLLCAAQHPPSHGSHHSGQHIGAREHEGRKVGRSALRRTGQEIIGRFGLAYGARGSTPPLVTLSTMTPLPATAIGPYRHNQGAEGRRPRQAPGGRADPQGGGRCLSLLGSSWLAHGLVSVSRGPSGPAARAASSRLAHLLQAGPPPLHGSGMRQP